MGQDGFEIAQDAPKLARSGMGEVKGKRIRISLFVAWVLDDAQKISLTRRSGSVAIGVHTQT